MRRLAAPLVLLVGCARTQPPNILLITMDTTRADALGSYGGRADTTPNLDALAKDGVRFERAYTVTPLTIPAHSSIMTGLYPPRHGVRDNGDFFLGADADTIAEQLKRRGYATMASVGAEVTSHHWGFAQGFDQFYDEMSPADGQHNRWAVERPGNVVVDDALAWWKARPADQPWFAWVHMYDAHHPYAAPTAYADRYPRNPYLGEVAFVDAQVGRMVDALRASGDLDHTWIFAVADHGEGLGEHGEAMHGVLLYDPTTHVPLIVKPPTGSPRVVTTPVSLVDLAPTILALGGAPPTRQLDGTSLIATILGGPMDSRRTVYAESLYAFHHYGWSPQRALVTDTDKLIDSTTPELYARADAAESDDLATTQADTLADRRAALNRLYDAMAPATVATQANLSGDQTAQLQALGYLTGGSSETPAGALPTGLPDPRTHLPSLRAVEGARQSLQSGDLPAARAQLEAVIAQEPGLTDPQLLLAQVLVRMNDPAAAEAVLRKLDAEHPGTGPKSLLGSLLLQQGHPAEAASVLRAALETDPYLLSAWLPYLHALLAGSDPSFAAEVARARAAQPDSVEIQGLAGFAAAIAGDYATARPLVEASLSANPNQPLLNHARGLIQAGAGDPVAAEASFQEEVRLFPPALASRRELVKIYADQKRYDEQLTQLAVVRQLLPGDAPTLHSQAQALYNLQRYPEAKTAVDDCRALAPQYAGCAMLEANVLEKLGRHSDAVAAYKLAMSMAGQEPKADPQAPPKAPTTPP